MNAEQPQETVKPAFVLFDGVCNLCNGSVAFIIRRDPDRRFKFAAIQSPAGRRLLRAHGLPADTLASVILIEEGDVYRRSMAALRIARRLTWPWPLFYVFCLVPRPIRDWAYDLVARYRYRLFGRRETCMLPTLDVRERFLD